jgi:hypothetical protein
VGKIFVEIGAQKCRNLGHEIFGAVSKQNLTREKCSAYTCGRSCKRPKKSTQTWTKLIPEGVSDQYQLLVGLNAYCEGESAYAEKENRLYE